MNLSALRSKNPPKQKQKKMSNKKGAVYVNSPFCDKTEGEFDTRLY